MRSTIPKLIAAGAFLSAGNLIIGRNSEIAETCALVLAKKKLNRGQQMQQFGFQQLQQDSIHEPKFKIQGPWVRNGVGISNLGELLHERAREETREKEAGEKLRHARNLNEMRMKKDILEEQIQSLRSYRK